MMGGVFSVLSLVFKTEFDVIAGVTYSLVVVSPRLLPPLALGILVVLSVASCSWSCFFRNQVLDGIVLILALILNPMARRRRAREAAANADVERGVTQETSPW